MLLRFGFLSFAVKLVCDFVVRIWDLLVCVGLLNTGICYFVLGGFLFWVCIGFVISGVCCFSVGFVDFECFGCFLIEVGLL